jgi:D-alanyl-D-alanine dipeptidase
MKRPSNLALLFLLAACAATNPYGLTVLDRAEYIRTSRADAEKELIDLAAIGIPLDIRYATADNFMKKTLYPVAKAYLRAPAARALMDVQRELDTRGLGIKVFRNPDYVADPAKGSRHNRGAAVDLTLIDLKTGRELAMPTPYDDFTPRAAHAFEDLPEDVRANRALLREVMTKHGFEPLPSEWWHYDFRGWERFELMDVGLEELP